MVGNQLMPSDSPPPHLEVVAAVAVLTLAAEAVEVP